MHVKIFSRGRHRTIINILQRPQKGLSRVALFKPVWIHFRTSISKFGENCLLANTFHHTMQLSMCIIMTTSSNENIFCVTGPLWCEFTGHRWIPLTKASDAELWCFLWSVPEQTVEQIIKMPSRSLWRHCNATWRFDSSDWGGCYRNVKWDRARSVVWQLTNVFCRESFFSSCRKMHWKGDRIVHCVKILSSAL